MPHFFWLATTSSMTASCSSVSIKIEPAGALVIDLAPQLLGKGLVDAGALHRQGQWKSRFLVCMKMKPSQALEVPSPTPRRSTTMGRIPFCQVVGDGTADDAPPMMTAIPFGCHGCVSPNHYFVWANHWTPESPRCCQGGAFHWFFPIGLHFLGELVQFGIFG